MKSDFEKNPTPIDLPADWYSREPYCHMTAERVRWLFNRLRPMVLPVGALLVAQDRNLSQVGVIVRGQAELFVQGAGKRKAHFGFVNPGQFYGFTALLCNGVSPYGLRSTESVVCWVVDRPDFRHLIERDIAVREYFYREAMARTECAYRKTRHIETHSERKVRCGRPVSAVIERSIVYLDSRYMEPISLEKVAAVCGMSKYCFSRRFNAETGCSLKSYLNRIRVAAAKEMLRQEDINISEACFAVGFNELSYFSRVFRRIEGQSPSGFLKSL